MTYKTVRFFQNDNVPRMTIDTGLTLEEAQAHCNSLEASSTTATSREAVKRTATVGAWFDGYYEET